MDELEALEKEIWEEMRKIYSERTLDHAFNPRNVGSLPDPDGFASYTGPCGDTMKIWLKVENGRIEKATFWTDGCGTSIAAGSAVTELVKGKRVEEALLISPEDVLAELGGLPEESQHCAVLAATTLKRALMDYLEAKREPWRKAYKCGGMR